MRQETETRNAGAVGCAACLWALSFLFALRVLGQAVQRWLPQPFLPAFDEFQGSRLPYGLLLSVQLLILAAMALASWRVHSGAWAPGRRLAGVLAWGGGIYMAGSLARIAIGLTAPAAPDWFRTWIPAIFHLVLAGFVLVLAFCRGSSAANLGEGRT